MDRQQKIQVAQRELVAAAQEFAFGTNTSPEDAGDVQAWLDTLQSLRRGEDVSLWETSKNGRGQVI